MYNVVIKVQIVDNSGPQSQIIGSVGTGATVSTKQQAEDLSQKLMPMIQEAICKART